MLLLVLNLAVTLYMVGVIWTVQLVHYPLMATVGKASFAEYHQRHVRMMTVVVGPSMLIEAFSMIAILGQCASDQFNLAALGTLLIFIIWLSTAFLQVPCHSKLEKSFDSKTHSFLVNSNWIRTIAWSLRGIVIAAMLLSVESA